MKKNLIKYGLLALAALAYFIIFEWNIIKYPMGWSMLWNGYKPDPDIPFSYSSSYFTTESCGKNCSTDRFFYENSSEKVIITYSDYVSWADDPKWDEKTKLKGTRYYYRVKNGVQHLYWENEKRDQEMEIAYYGNHLLPERALIKMAESVGR